MKIRITKLDLLALCIIMDFPFYIDTIYNKYGTAHCELKGVPGRMSYIVVYICPLNVVLVIANSVEPDEMHFIWVYTVCQSTRLGVSCIQRVNPFLQRLLTPLKYHVCENIMKNGAFALLEQMLHFP